MDLEAIILATTALVAAAGGIVLNLTLGAKNLAEARKIREDTKATAHQLQPNSGGSVSDAVTRIENRGVELARSVGSIRDDVRGLREEKANDHLDIRRRLVHIEEKVFPSAQTPSSIIEPPRRRP